MSGDIGRAMAGDVDPTYLGYEVWASAGELYTCKGVSIGTGKPSNNFGIWWDGDLCRELLDGVKLDKWNYTSKALNRILTLSDYGATSNNSTKANPCLTADLLGDWREEILLRSTNNSSWLLFTTTTPTSYRLYTLMHNPQYRTAIAWQNTAYNQPPYPDYYLGTGMSTPPQPNIYIPNNPALRTASPTADVIPATNALVIRPNPVDNAAYLDYKSESTRLIVVISAGDGRVVFRRTW